MNVKSIRLIYSAHIRYKTFSKAKNLANQGYVVLFDRYPLKDFWNMKFPMDGPRIKTDNFMGRLEKKYYTKISVPDYLYILRVDENESIQRKPEHASPINRAMLKTKIQVIKEFSENCKSDHFVIDTNKDQGEVILDVKRNLWGIV